MHKQNEATMEFSKRLRASVASATGPRHGPVDVIRIALWCQTLKQRVQALTIYQLEQRLEPRAFGANEHGDPYHWNKWSYYQIGKHKPRRQLVDLAEKEAPGSTALLEHVLWDVLKEKQNTSQLLSKGLRRLSPEVQEVIFDRHGNQKYERLQYRQLRMLERRAGIDALAALSILLRRASDQGDGQGALDIGISLHRVLLITCTYAVFDPLAEEFFKIFNTRIFPKACSATEKIWFDESYSFRLSTFWLNVLRLQLEDNNQIGVSHNEQIKAMCKLMDGFWGYDVKFMLDPHITPIHPRSDENKKEYELSDSRVRLRKWAMMVILSGKQAKFPPDDIW